MTLVRPSCVDPDLVALVVPILTVVDRCNWLALRQGGRLVAAAAWLARADGTAGLYSDCVAPEWRGIGLHRRLIAERLRAAAETGCHRAAVAVAANNLPCLANYLAFGFGYTRERVRGVSMPHCLTLTKPLERHRCTTPSTS
jgi:GNAT superfamily N-acetyltransferase